MKQTDKAINSSRLLNNLTTYLLVILLCVVAVFAIGKCFEPKAMLAMGFVQKPSSGHAKLLKKIIDSHPKKEISHDFKHKLAKGEIELDFEDTNSFGLSRVGVASFYIHKVKGKGTVPAFRMSVGELMDKGTSDGYKKCVLYHEYVHYQQYINKAAPHNIFELHGDDEKLTKDVVYWLFESESQAYIKEAELAKELGCLKELPDFMSDYVRPGRGITALRRGLAMTYSQIPAFAPFAKYLEELAKQPPKLN